MCKKIKDILHIFNIKGNDRKSVSHLINVPVVMNRQNLPISWIGERLVISYTQVTSHRSQPIQYVSHKDTHTDGDGVEFTMQFTNIAHFPLPDGGYSRPLDGMVYFDCTNVTSLIVNGDVLI